MESERQRSFTVDGKTVDVFPSASADCPIVYLNTFAGEGKRVRKTLEMMGCPDFTLVAVGNLEWDHDMAPWDIPAISETDTACTGGADDFLELLLERIMPEAEASVPGEPSWRGLAGYSLAGLFAVYAAYRTALFSRIASMSGSLWFPGFVDFAQHHDMKRTLDHVYFSLGNKECETDNPFLKSVQVNTEALTDFYQSERIDTVFQLNPGDHYTEPMERTARGIFWIVTR